MAKIGRKEILTESLAKQLCRIIEGMPDARIPVTWNNVIIHTQKLKKHKFNRQMLSQKKWEGRKLIAEAFHEAKSVQRRMLKDVAPKYQPSARSILQKRIKELEAKVFALHEELEKVRYQQMTELDSYLNTRCDLPSMLHKIRGHV